MATVKFDAAQFLDQAEKYAKALLGASDAVKDLTASTTKYNSQHEISQQKLKGVTESGKAFEVTVRNNKGTLEIFNATLKETSNELDKTGGQFSRAGSAGQSAGQRIFISWQGVLRLFESQALRIAMRSIIQEFSTAVTTSQEYSTKIAKLEVLSGQGAEATQKWTTDLRKLSEAYGIPQLQVADAAYVALQSGQFKAGESTALLNAAFKLSKITMLDTDQSIKLLSSTLNAYGLKATDSERVTNVLFKTIQNSAVNTKDFADKFSTLAFNARGTGVKLEELAATLTLLTNKGVDFDSAATTIETTLKALREPSIILKEVFKKLGVTSSQAFLSSLKGFGGVLKFFNDAAASGKDLGELTTKFLALQSVTQLGVETFNDFAPTLAKFSAELNVTDKALKTVQSSIGEQFTKQLTNIRTFFTDEIGAKFASGLITVGNAIGGDEGLAGGVKRLISILGIGVGAWAAYKISIYGVNTALVIATAAQTAWDAMTLTNIKSMATATFTANTYSASLRTLGAAIPIIAAGVAAGYIFNKIDESGKQPSFEAIKQDIAQKSLDSQKENVKRQLDDESRITSEVRKAYDERYNILLGYSTKSVALAEDLRKRAVDNLKEVSKATQVSAKTYTDELSRQIGLIKEKATEAKRLIKESLKLTQEVIPEKYTQTIFAQKLKFADPGQVVTGGGIVNDQQAILIQNRMDSILASAKNKFKEGTKISVEEARKLFDEVEKLQGQLFDKNAEQRKKAAQDEFAAKGTISDPSARLAIDANGKLRLEYTVQTAQYENQINQLTKERLKLEEDFRNQQIARQKIEIENAEREKARLNTLHQLIIEAANFTVLDQQGKVKKDFKDDPTLAARKFQDIIDKINAAAGPEQTKNQLSFFADLYKQKTAIVKEAEVQITAELAKQGQRRLEFEKETNDRKIKDAAEKQANAIKDAAKFQSKLEGSLEAFIQKGTSTASQFGNVTNPFSSDFKLKKEEEALIARSEKFRQIAIEAGETAKAAQKDFLADPSAKTAETLSNKINVLTVAVQDYINVRGAFDAQSGKFVTGPNVASHSILPGETNIGPNTPLVTDRAKELTNISSELASAYKTIAAGKADIESVTELTKKYDIELAKIPKSFDDMAIKSNLAAQEMQKNFDNSALSLDKLINKMDTLNKTLINLNKEIPQLQGNRPEQIPGGMFGGPVSYFATGGYVGRGSDNIPAMLSRGE